MVFIESEPLPEPKFLNILSDISNPYNPPTTLCGSANFYRTLSNTNIELIVPMGLVDSGVYISPNIYLPQFIFNATEETNALDFVNDVDAKVLLNSIFIHDVVIQYKITKSTDATYLNNRHLQATLVKSDGITLYDDAITSYTYPESDVYDTLILRGCISHTINDIIKIKLKLLQDTISADNTTSKLTISKISWNILCIVDSLTISYSQAIFYRTPTNIDIAIPLTLGTDLLLTNIFTSPNGYLPSNAFNSTKQNAAVVFPTFNYAQILQSYTYTYDIYIQFKLTKLNGTNYINNRELRTNIVRADANIVYNDAMVSSFMPTSGQIEYILIKGCIFHDVNDISRLQFKVIQDDASSDKSDSLLTITYISWIMNIEYVQVNNVTNITDAENIIDFKQIIGIDTIYYLTPADHAIEIISDTYNIVQLPSAVGNGGRLYTICRGSNNNNLVLKAATGDTIDTRTQLELKRKNDHLEIMCNGIDSWYIT